MGRAPPVTEEVRRLPDFTGILGQMRTSSRSMTWSSSTASAPSTLPWARVHPLPTLLSSQRMAPWRVELVPTAHPSSTERWATVRSPKKVPCSSTVWGPIRQLSPMVTRSAIQQGGTTAQLSGRGEAHHTPARSCGSSRSSLTLPSSASAAACR